MPIITIVGIGLAKKVVQVHGVDAEGKVVGARKLRRKEVLAFFPKLPGSTFYASRVSTSRAGSGQQW
jgi:transposase